LAIALSYFIEKPGINFNQIRKFQPLSMKAGRTRSQEQILNLLQSLNRAISAQDIYIELRSRKQSIGLATVYRSLDALKLEGVVQVRTLASGESLYSSVQQDKHHLTCLQCGKSIPIHQCPVHELETQLHQSHKFKIFYHTLEFFGLCNQCQLAEELH
jgi:Fur family ferric uptake transcriptional regulator